MREATRAGEVQFGLGDAYEADGDVPVTRCYGGALVRFTDNGREVTVVSTGGFMTNSGLLKDGNAALAMNLAGSHQRVIWYAPQHSEGTRESGGGETLYDLMPDQVMWIFLQLCIGVALLALWKGRRIGPLVAEQLPVVVRASETVEGRGRLYRSRRARDRAAEALRTATLQRMIRRWRTHCSVRLPPTTPTWSTSLTNSTTSKGRSLNRDSANSAGHRSRIGGDIGQSTKCPAGLAR